MSSLAPALVSVDVAVRTRDDSASDGACFLPGLLPELAEEIARYANPNDVALCVRLACRAARRQFNGATRVRLSQLCTPAEFTRKWGARGAVRHLTLAQRRLLLCLTAATGSIENLALLVLGEHGARVSGASRAAPASGGGGSSEPPPSHDASPHAGSGGVAGCTLTPDVLAAAAAANQAAACAWLLQRGCPGLDSALEAAAEAGHGSLIDQLLSSYAASSSTHSSTHSGCASGSPCTHRMACAAARGGHVGLLERLLLRDGSRAVRWGLVEEDAAALLAAAAEGCRLAGLQAVHAQVLRARGQQGLYEDAHRKHVVQAAARSRTPDWREKLTWLCGGLEAQGEGQAQQQQQQGGGGGYPRTAQAYVGACGCGSGVEALERVRWLHENGGFMFNPWAVDAAAKAGHVDALSYLLSRGCPADEHAAWNACYAGQLPAVQLLVRKRGCSLPYGAVAGAAAGGGGVAQVAWLVRALAAQQQQQQHQQHQQHQQAQEQQQELLSYTLELSHAEQQLLSPKVFAAAARSGSVELLEWLRRHGCGQDGSALAEAARSGCEAALEWLLAEARSPVRPDGRAYAVAAANGDLATLACLHRLGVPWAAWTFTEAARQGAGVEALRWLRARGCPVDWAGALEGVCAQQHARRGDRPLNGRVVAWLEEGAARQAAEARAEEAAEQRRRQARAALPLRR